MYDIIKIGTDDEYNPQFITEVEVQKVISQTSRFLNCFIEFMQKEAPDILTKTLSLFKERLSQFEGIELDQVSFEHNPKNFESFPDAFEHIISVRFALLKYNEYIRTEKD
jgi:hypothetical protein